MSDNLHFDDDIKQGEEYQDFIQHELAKRGMMFLCNTSKQYQWYEGESMGGLEIKLDRKLKDTGNVFIECLAENKDKTKMVDGGIFKKDNAWLYLIGDYSKAYILSKPQLQKIWLDVNLRSTYIKNGMIVPKTMYYSEGFLLTEKFLSSSAWVLKTLYFD